MTEIEQIKQLVKDLQDKGHMILTWTGRYGKYYILNIDGYICDVDRISQLEAQIMVIDLWQLEEKNSD